MNAARTPRLNELLSKARLPMLKAQEFNFDGIVGPTHHYAGLSFGNRASMENRHRRSNPRAAALQGLAKMKLLAELGVPQAVLPPQERPHLPTLRALGYSGSDVQIIERVVTDEPGLLSAASSASSMWAANAATVSPSADCADGKVHFTPANLISQPHRAIEAPQTARVLKRIFPKSSGRFIHHEPLAPELADEGAANHTRLAPEYGSPGVELFTFGRSAADANSARRFPARQTHEASIAIARAHRLHPDRVAFVRQSPTAIDAGAFHNDVVAVGNLQTLLHHNKAYLPGAAAHLQTRVSSFIPVAQFLEWDGPVDDAIRSYVFNSQLVRLPDGSQSLIAPMQAFEIASARHFIESVIAGGAVQTVHYVDLRESMQNGGGPACLRLRVVLTDDEGAHVHRGVLWSHALHDSLVAWVQRWYRESLHVDELADPSLLRESRDALSELSTRLSMNALYEFQ